MAVSDLDQYRKLRVEVLDEYHNFEAFFGGMISDVDADYVRSHPQFQFLKLLWDREYAEHLAVENDSYLDFVECDEPKKLWGFLENRTNVAQANATLAITFQLARWRHYGRSCYVFTDGLSEYLVNAKLGKIPTSYFQLPFPSFYIQFESSAGCNLYDPTSGNHKLVGALVTQTKEEYGRTLRICLVGEPNEESVSPADDSFYYINFVLDPDVTMTQVLETQADLASLDRANWNFRYGISVETYHELISRASRLVINSILYIISDRSDLIRDPSPLPGLEKQLEQELARKSPKKRQRHERRRRKQLEQVTGVERVVVGRNVQKRYSSGSRDGTTPSGRRSPRWHMVEFHIKLQRHGKGRQLKKVVTIMPYSRGNADFGRVEKTIVERP